MYMYLNNDSTVKCVFRTLLEVYWPASQLERETKMKLHVLVLNGCDRHCVFVCSFINAWCTPMYILHETGKK